MIKSLYDQRLTRAYTGIGLYNARILIHRPFLVASSASYNSSEFSQHVEICLDASRKTIQMIYDCFAHRIYLRTW